MGTRPGSTSVFTRAREFTNDVWEQGSCEVCHQFISCERFKAEGVEFHDTRSSTGAFAYCAPDETPPCRWRPRRGELLTDVEA